MVSARVTTAMGKGWKVAIGIVVGLAVLLGVNALVVDRETKAAGVTVPGGRILKLQGGELQVLEGGPRSGSPIVLLHCYSCAMDWWDGMIPALERKHRVIAIDLLGFGGSEKPETGYSIENQSSLVSEALRPPRSRRRDRRRPLPRAARSRPRCWKTRRGSSAAS